MSNAHNHKVKATLEIQKDGLLFKCSGYWDIAHTPALEERIKYLSLPFQKKVTIDVSSVAVMDSAGVLVLEELLVKLKSRNNHIDLIGLNEAQKTLLSLVDTKYDQLRKAYKPPKRPNWLYITGKETIEKSRQVKDYISFVGELIVTFFRVVFSSRHIQWRSVFRAIEHIGYRALPIIALLSFLIGVVLAYQLGTQLESYGADIYIVNVIGYSVLREFAPLITAIIAAGRTSAAITAQIGTMKVNEEVDALRAMGMSPFNRLILPKVVGALIAIPLLTVWANIFGVFGGMVMSKYLLAINYRDFFSRFDEVVSVQTFLVGMSKSPFFALIVSIVGCFQGMQVISSAESVGFLTTKSVVQAIFLIIIVDAAFSVIYSILGI